MRSIRLGRAFGIPLFIHWTFFLLPLWMLFLSRNEDLPTILFGQVLLLSIFGCVLLHELGHALMARFFGIRTRDITLYPIGGVARLESMGESPHEEVCIALAGPAVNLAIVVLLAPFVALAFLSGVLLGPAASGFLTAQTLAAYLTLLMLANGVLLLFNLLPAFPMDGGRVLRALLSLGIGRLRATEVAATVALFLAGGLALLGVLSGNYTLILVAVAVCLFGQLELAHLRRLEAARRLAPVSVSVTDPVVTVLPPVTGPFTGFIWDNDNGVWVRWIDGRPAQSR